MTTEIRDYFTVEFILNLKIKALFLKLLPSLGEKMERSLVSLTIKSDKKSPII